MPSWPVSVYLLHRLVRGWVKRDCTAVNDIPKIKGKKKIVINSESDAGFFDFYAFRHTFMTRLGESWLPMASIKTLGRHSPAEMSVHYMHFDNDLGRAAIEAMPDL